MGNRWKPQQNQWQGLDQQVMDIRQSLAKKHLGRPTGWVLPYGLICCCLYREYMNEPNRYFLKCGLAMTAKLASGWLHRCSCVHPFWDDDPSECHQTWHDMTLKVQNWPLKNSPTKKLSPNLRPEKKKETTMQTSWIWAVQDNRIFQCEIAKPEDHSYSNGDCSRVEICCVLSLCYCYIFYLLVYIEYINKYYQMLFYAEYIYIYTTKNWYLLWKTNMWYFQLLDAVLCYSWLFVLFDTSITFIYFCRLLHTF